MSIKLRLALLLGLLILGFLAALLALGLLEQRERSEMLARERQARTLILNHAIDFASRSLPQFVTEAAQAGEFVPAVAHPELPESRRQIESQLTATGLSTLWLMRGDGTVRARFGQRSEAAEPLGPADFAAVVAETPSPRFFAEWDRELHEVAIRRLLHLPGNEWLMVTRRWDEAYLRGLSQVTESEVSLREVRDATMTPPEDAIVLVRTLADWRGHPLRVLRIEHQEAGIDQVLESNSRQLQVFLAFGLMVIAATWLVLQGWVLQPLARIGESLATNSPQPVESLSAEKSELGRVAGLVRSSFEQREALEREVRERASAQAALQRSEAALQANLEERSRLGRDLHDGVIQSLYSAGMGLTGVRALLGPEQTEAASRLEQSSAALNETIHDVRNFLIGLEPESLKLHTFSQAVTALLEMMRGHRPFQSRVEIDDGLAARLSLAQRVHALQIAREAVSNALRHGAANRIGVSLQTRHGLAEFEVTDDGRGGGGQIQGSIVAQSIDMNGGPDFHYDQALGNLGASVGVGVRQWKELQTAAERAVYASKFP